jgi:hypothetical protein
MGRDGLVKRLGVEISENVNHDGNHSDSMALRWCQMFESQAIPLSDIVPVAQARMKKAGNLGKGAIDLVQDRPPLLWRHG